jgi:hypothetical protein
MVMALLRGMRHSDHQYSAISVREAKYTRFGYMTKLHTLDLSFSISFFEKKKSFGNTGPQCKHLGPGRYVSVINDNH